MTDDGRDWQPTLERPAGTHFKWGFDAETEQFTIWEVSVVGDGLPTHQVALQAAWGRPPQPGRDCLGSALVGDDTVTLVAYYDAELPSEAETWARERFPQHDIEATRIGVRD